MADKKKKPWKKILIGTGLAVTAGITAAALTADKYTTLTEGEVIEEKHVRTLNSEGKVDKDHYVLYIGVEEKDENENPRETIYTLNVVENSKMPLAVLDEIIGTGTLLWFEHLRQGILWSAPEPVYSVGRFGSIDSIDLKVVTAGESSDQVKIKLGDELAERRRIERLRARTEANEYYGNRIIY